MAATVVELAAFTPVPAPRYRPPLLAASIRVAMASTCMCGTPRTCSASARRPRAGVFAGHGDAAGHRARVVHERAVGVARGHPVGLVRRDFPGRHARRGAHGRDRHAHGAVLAAAHVAQGRPPAPPALVVAHPPPQNVRASSEQCERVRDVAAEPAEQSALPSPRGRNVDWLSVCATSTSLPACVKHRRAPRPVEARRLYRGLASQG